MQTYPEPRNISTQTKFRYSPLNNLNFVKGGSNATLTQEFGFNDKPIATSRSKLQKSHKGLTRHTQSMSRLRDKSRRDVVDEQEFFPLTIAKLVTSNEDQNGLPSGGLPRSKTNTHLIDRVHKRLMNKLSW